MILSYLEKNPDAGDTAEGITRWWLEMERIDNAVEEVQAVLESLVRSGEIKMHNQSGGRIYYMINDSR